MLFVFRRSQRTVADPDIDVLIVVTEGLAVNRQAADMLCGIGNSHFQLDAALGGQAEPVNGDTADLQTVDIGSLMIDDEHFQKSVLIPVREPPVGSKDNIYIPEVSGR